jgi:hypothetical protein
MGSGGGLVMGAGAMVDDNQRLRYLLWHRQYWKTAMVRCYQTGVKLSIL